jgi:type I restriction enzyme M protein
MPKNIIVKPSETFLSLQNAEQGLFPLNHIFEPEFHQEEYVQPGKIISGMTGAFQLGKCPHLLEAIHRGTQPSYVDIESEPDSLYWKGMTLRDGSQVAINDKDANICALKSVSIRNGFIDLENARSVSQEFYESKRKKAGVKKNDVLVNSTGDGTIGRVAVFNYDFPAMVDGHVSILRFDDPDYAWFVAAFLLSDDGQKQIYRYINGSSGQVEIYPQDIARIWMKPLNKTKISNVASTFRDACIKHDEFQKELKKSLSLV